MKVFNLLVSVTDIEGTIVNINPEKIIAVIYIKKEEMYSIQLEDKIYLYLDKTEYNRFLGSDFR